MCQVCNLCEGFVNDTLVLYTSYHDITNLFLTLFSDCRISMNCEFRVIHVGHT